MTKSFCKLFLAPLTVLALASFAMVPIAEARPAVAVVAAMPVAVVLAPVAVVAAMAVAAAMPRRWCSRRWWRRQAGQQ